MKIKRLFCISILLSIFSGCLYQSSKPTPTDIPTKINSVTPSVPTTTSIPKGKTIVVTSVDDSGPGTLRLALEDAQSGDIITFNQAVFPPDNPEIIMLNSALPTIHQGYITVDASDAGVILDGMGVGEWEVAFNIESENNIIRGINIQNFHGAGFVLNIGANGNVIGGDRETGKAQYGQGNVIVNCGNGLIIRNNGNTITGNLIGTDGSERTDSGNFYPGIAFEMQASDNIIGPENVIAYNGVDGNAGVEFQSEGAVNNRITENTMFNNTGGSISYCGTAADMESFSTIPIIMEFNLAEGFVIGLTCPNCIVEIFSSNSTEGEKFEGLTTADALGFFKLQIEENFEGPYLLANSFEEGQNTSSFSHPTSGLKGAKTIQEGNYSPVSKIQSPPTTELEESRFGQMGGNLKASIHSEQDAEIFVNQNKYQLGTKNVRISFDYFDFGEVDWNAGEYSKFIIDPNHGSAIDGLIDAGITVRYCLVFWDPESPGQITTPGYSRFKQEGEIQRYLEYARFIVKNFKGRIKYYEILNEPRLEDGNQQTVKVEDYIELVRRVIPVIHQEDPSAKIVVGAIGSLHDPKDYDFLLNILLSDIVNYVDGISFHPMHGVSPDYELRKDYYDYPFVVQEIKDIANASGFNGEYFADELTWRTAINPFVCEPWIYSEIAAAKYHARGIILNLGMNIRTSVGLEALDELPYITDTVRNISTVMAGATPIDLQLEIRNEIDNVVSYNFSKQNEDKLVALWADGVAVDDDPGVNSIIVINGLSAEKVVGIDLLNSIEQELMFSVEDGNLVIRDLLIKDYPIMLQITESSSP